jgi:hypothetical protein
LRGRERVEPEREVGGECGRVRAAGAVRGAVGVALAGDLDQPLAVVEEVGRLVAVAAGDDDRPRPERVDGAGQLGGAGVGGQVRERGGLGQVRRHDGRAREQLGAERPLGLGREQPRARLGHHHRVDDQRRVGEQRERLGDGRDRGRVAEHPGLDGVGADVVGDRPHLGDDRRRRQRVHVRDGDGVLRRHRRDRAHAVHAAACERLQVGLDPGAAAGVRAGDREHPRRRLGWGGHAASRIWRTLVTQSSHARVVT